jgi:hypothetical protein
VVILIKKVFKGEKGISFIIYDLVFGGGKSWGI